MTTLVEYEKVPEKFRAFQAPVDMELPAKFSGGPLTPTGVKEGQWVILLLEGGVHEIVDADVFATKYRVPLVPYSPCGRAHSDYMIPGPNQWWAQQPHRANL